MANMNKVTSYRLELEGIFWALKHIEYLNCTPRELDQWFDYKQAVYNSMHYPRRPTDMLGTNMDLVLTIHHLKSILTATVNCRYVYKHQDRVRDNSSRKEQNHDTTQKTPQEARGSAPLLRTTPPTSH